MTYRIMCKVWGGPSGPHQSYLKKADGEMYEENEQRVAEIHAEMLTKSMTLPGRKKDFSYTVVKVNR